MGNEKLDRYAKYYSLTKSGLVYGNLITVLAGFALGSRGHFYFSTLIATAIGMCLVMASGCVFNNYIDRDIDANMARTKDRALVTGQISGRSAILFAAALGFLGLIILGVFANALAMLVAFFGFFAYVVLYSLWAKRRTTWGTEVGSISGAVPPVAGYAAASGRVDGAALTLFAIMVVWQMPHFYAIAIRRADEYAAAKIPVLPVARGVFATKIRMLIYIIAFLFIAPLLAIFGYAGYGYLVIAVLLGIVWLMLCTQGILVSGEVEDARWAKRVFLFSLVVMVVLFATIGIGALLR